MSEKIRRCRHLLIEPREELKSPIDRSGEHPFSGVRCQSVLALDADDPAQMMYSITSVHVPDPITDTLKRIAAGGGE